MINFLRAIKLFYCYGSAKVTQKDLSFYDSTSLKLDTLVPSSHKVSNICTDTSVSLIEFCSVNAVSSSSESNTIITSVLYTIINVASK